jgi:hypothetical protein
MRRSAGLAAALASTLVVSFTACGSSSAPDPLTGYVDTLNAVQRRAAPRFQSANATYKKVAKGQLGGRSAAFALRRAELDIEGARQRIEAVRAPPEATRLRRLLLRAYALNVLMAADTRQMAVYSAQSKRLLAPLGALRKRLRSRLAQAAGPAGQIRALRSYALAVRRIRLRLDRLNPPPLLASTREAQQALLQRAGPLASQLADAIGRRDPQAVARLTVRFRSSGVSPRQTRGLLRGSILAYRERLVQLDRAGAAAQTELARLLRDRES